jgi:hypothetical protein
MAVLMLYLKLTLSIDSPLYIPTYHRLLVTGTHLRMENVSVSYNIYFLKVRAIKISQTSNLNALFPFFSHL